MKHSASKIALLLLVVAGNAAVAVGTRRSKDRVTCRAHNGQPVDWFVIYKLPARTESGRAGRGLDYLYMDSNGAAQDGAAWIAANVTIDSVDSMPGLTLRTVYSSDTDLVLMYNDELPNGTSSETAAHAKGVLAFDGDSGFWMTHSIPRYPPMPNDGYSYPPSGTRYGQTMLCVSLDFKNADLIGKQLLYYRPFVYVWRSGGFDVPNLSAVARGDHIVQAPWFRRAELASRERSIQLASFAKSRPFGRDLYSEWMAGELGSPLFVETWSNGQGHPMPSNCSNRNKFSVLNVKEVRLVIVGSEDPANFTSETFSSHDDHSKWAVSGNENEPWVCIADINRMESQRHRGGGSLCFRHVRLWRQFSRAADRLEPCPLNSDHVSLGFLAPKSFKPTKKKMAMSKMKVKH